MLETDTDAETVRRREAGRLAQKHEMVSFGSPLDGWEIASYLDQFRAVGFFRSTGILAVVDGRPVRVEMISFADVRPRSAMMLYRCSSPEVRTRPSWTPSLDLALQFARGGARGGWHADPHLFTVTAPPDRILAILHSEYIVDVEGLNITDHGPIESYQPTMRPLGEVVEQFPHLMALLLFHGPDMPVAVEPSELYLVTPENEQEALGGR